MILNPQRFFNLLLFLCCSLIALGILVATPSAVVSQASPPPDLSLSLKDCLDYANRYSPSLQAAYSEIDAKKAALQGAHANFWMPSLTASGSASYKKQDIQYKSEANGSSSGEPTIPDPVWINGPTELVTEADVLNLLGLNSSILSSGIDSNSLQKSMSTSYNPFSGSASLQIAKPLFAGFALKNQIELSKANLHLSRLKMNLSQKELEKRIIEIYFSLLFLKEALKVAEEGYSIAKESFNAVQGNYDTGLVDELTLLQSQTTYEKAKPSLLTAQDSLRQAKESLLILIGYRKIVKDKELVDRIEIVGEFREESFAMEYEDILQQMQLNRIELSQMEQQIDLLRINRRLAQSAFYPTISAFGNVTLTTSNNFEEKTSTSGWVVTGGMQMSFSLSDLLFPKNKTYSTLKEIDHTIIQMQETKKAMEDGYVIEIRSNLATFNQAKENLSIRREIYKLSERTFQLANEQFKQGLINFLDFRQIEIQYLQSRLEVVQELFNYNKALVNLRYTMGEKLYKNE